MTIAAFAGLSFSSQNVSAEELMAPGQPTLTQLQQQGAVSRGSAYTVVDNAADSNTGISYTQYTYDDQTHQVTEETKYININKTTYSDGDLTYSWDDENNKLIVTPSGEAVNVDGEEYVGNSGVAVSNGGTITTQTGDFIDNSGNNGGAIYNRKTITEVDGNFIGNSASASGGGINNYDHGEIGSITGDFIGNSAEINGGAIYDEFTNKTDGYTTYRTYIGPITGDFINNSAGSSGGAIYHGSTSSFISTKIDSVTGNFINNSAGSNGGAIYNGANRVLETVKIDSITGDFVGNTANSNGGAIYNGTNKSSDNAIIGSITGNFVDNHANYGGAIYNYVTANGSGSSTTNIGTITGNFIGNTARAYGGAIYNYASSSRAYCRTTIDSITGDFVNNSAGSGGAIYNHSAAYNQPARAELVLITGNFVGNTATNGDGGAVHNSDAIMTTVNANFSENSAARSGGAIYNRGQIKNLTGNFTNNSANGNGGAINDDGGTIETVTGDFTGNTAGASGGAISTSSYSNIGSITGNFTNNSANEGDGGALYNSGNIQSLNGDFNNNTAGKNGGAIYNYGATAVEKMVENNGYSSIEEMALDRGHSSVEDMIDGYQTFEEFAHGRGYRGFTEWMKREGYSSAEEYVQNQGYSSVEEMAQDWGYSSADEMLNSTATSEMLRSYGCSSEEELAESWEYDSVESLLAGDSTVYSSVEEMAQDWGYDETRGGITFTGENTLSNNKANGKLNDIYNDGIITLAQDATVTSNSGIDGKEGVVYLEPNSTLNVNHYLKGQNVNIDNATINLGAIKQADGNVTYGTLDLAGLAVSENGGNLNTLNNHVYAHNLGAVTLYGDLNYTGDVDLANEKMDSLSATSFEGSGHVVVKGLNLISDSKNLKTEVYFTNLLKNNVKNEVTEIGKGVSSKYQTTAFAPIYKYNVKYENRDDAGYFVFTRPGSSGGDSPSPEPFNPAVLASPVAAQAGASATMNQALSFAFEHGETFMNNSAMDRFAMTHDNVYALSSDYNENLGRIDYSHENKSVWVKPYSVFENIKLKNGPKVDTISYGTLIGFDSNIHKMRKGWYNVGTAYIGYNGSQMDYGSVDASTNGGLLGVTETFYKGNFWTALTATAGAAGAEARTMYGKDDMTMLMAGIGSKTGYNFEFADGKFIIQPRMFVAYSMVKTFDYTNAAGVRIDSDPVHTIQVNPAIKFIGNTKNGWQPYASVGMMWNLLNEVHATADGIKLPEMQTKPYVEYGVGVQKLWNDKYSAYGQAMVRNGGKNGIALTLGFRMSLGKEGKPIEKVENDITYPQETSLMNTSRSSMIGIVK